MSIVDDDENVESKFKSSAKGPDITASGTVRTVVPEASKLRNLAQLLQNSPDGRAPTDSQSRGLVDQLQRMTKLEQDLATVRISNAQEFQQMLKTKPFKTTDTTATTSATTSPGIVLDQDVKVDTPMRYETKIDHGDFNSSGTAQTSTRGQTNLGPDVKISGTSASVSAGTNSGSGSGSVPIQNARDFFLSTTRDDKGSLAPPTRVDKASASATKQSMVVIMDEEQDETSETKETKQQIHVLNTGEAMPSKAFKQERDMTWLHEALALKNQGNEEFKAKDYLPAARSYTAALILVYDNELRVNVNDTDLVLYSELLHSRSKALYQLKAWPLALADMTLIPQQSYTLKTWQQRAEIAGAFGLYEEQQHCLEAQIPYFTDGLHGGKGEKHEYDKIKQLRSRIKSCKVKLDLALNNLERKTHDSVVPLECPYIPFVFWTARDLGLEYNQIDVKEAKYNESMLQTPVFGFTPAATFMKNARQTEDLSSTSEVLKLMQKMSADGMVEFKEIPGRGIGMVAKRDIKQKEIVWREKPLLFAEVGKTLHGTSIRGLCDMCGSSVSVVQVKAEESEAQVHPRSADMIATLGPPNKKYELQPLSSGANKTKAKTKTDKNALITDPITRERTIVADALLSAPRQDMMQDESVPTVKTSDDDITGKAQDCKAAAAEIKSNVKFTVVRGAHVSCQFCPYESYCSEQCRDTAFQRYHKSLCGQDYERLRSMAIESGDLSWRVPILIFKLIGMARNNGKRTPMQLPIVDHWLELTRERLTKTKIPHSGTRLINCFQQVSDTSNSFGDPLLDAQFYDAMEQMISSCSHSSLSKLDTDRDAVAAERMMGVGLFPGASMINHSCKPNVDWSIAMDRKSQGLEVVAMRNISKGQEICYSYVREELAHSRRAKLLWEQHGFICECERCLKDRKR